MATRIWERTECVSSGFFVVLSDCGICKQIVRIGLFSRAL